MSEEIRAATILVGLYDRIEELRARNHDLANEIMQERAKRIALEADCGAHFEALQWLYDDWNGPSTEALTRAKMALISDHPGAALLAVAQAAAAFVEAGEYDDLASLLLELKEKVKEWRR